MPAKTGARILVCGVNWVGDTIMSMPALEAYRAAHPADHIAVLVKPAVRPLWEAHAAPDEILPLEEGLAGTWRTARTIKTGNYERAYVLPHSFRSALIPWLAGVPARVGLPGYARAAMLTEVVAQEEGKGRGHQAWEYVTLLGLAAGVTTLRAPHLSLGAVAVERAASLLQGVAKPRAALIPGAARGPSKQWPPSHFADVGVRLRNEGYGVVVLGTSAEHALCREVATDAGPGAISLAGKTNMAEWMAILRACDLVVCNDSGGMHVAAALGTPVVALFGMTDPEKTGPLGSAVRVLQNSTTRSRDIARDSEEARKKLASIGPELVYEAAVEVLASAAEQTRG